ncbi:uncharacterized protein LOC120334321 [Styela clava]
MNCKITVLLVVTFGAIVNGHGRLRDPPSRSTVWRDEETIRRYPDVTIPKNYDDVSLFCGGSQVQKKAGGKCGVCGDSIHDIQPRKNEAGGKYSLGLISRIYKSGSWIDVTVEITAQHKGYFEFRLCDWNKPKEIVTQECLDRHLLETNMGFKYSGITKTGKYVVPVKLPEGLTCTQCVLQWKYNTGNSWGCDAPGVRALGLGHQEQFYGCADVKITGNNEQTTETGSTSSTSTTMLPTAIPTISSITKETITSRISNTGNIKPPTEPCKGIQFGRLYNWDCESYYVCLQGFEKPFVMRCPINLLFDESKQTCNWRFLVPPPCDNYYQQDW